MTDQRPTSPAAPDAAGEAAPLADDLFVPDETAEVAEAAQAVEVDLEALLAERDQFRDIALRLQADFENFRKRADRQAADQVDRESGRIVEDLLPVLDACELAYAHGADGVEPIWSALLGALRRHGLDAMDPLGKPFDPTQEEAVLHEPGDGDEATVVDVLRTGYSWKGKVLRPAMVKVRG